jgi:GNAT superfamily N-acetyltransferase
MTSSRNSTSSGRGGGRGKRAARGAGGGRSKRAASDKLEVRRACPEDRDAILEVSRDIWGGNDYLPTVWDRWAADREGALLTVTLNGKPIGCTKISMLSPGEVWLEGLRLHPDFQGRGLSHRIHEGTFEEALRLGARTIRYATWIGNEASRHIAETHGFWMVAQTNWLGARAGIEKQLKSRRAGAQDVNDLHRFVKGSACYEATGGLMGVGWKFPEITKRRLRGIVADGRALILPKRGAIRAAALIDIDGAHDDMCMGFIEGSDADIALLALDAQSVAAASGRDEILAMLPEGRISDAVRRAGYDAAIPMQAVVYELGARGLETMRGRIRAEGAPQLAALADRSRSGGLASLLDRTYRANEPEIAARVAELLAEKAGACLDKQNVRDYVLREILPDTTRKLMAAVLDFSNSLKQNNVRLVLRAIVMHLHREYGLSGSAMEMGTRTISVDFEGRRIVHVRCAKTSLTMTLGPGFGPCFVPDIALDVAAIRLDEGTRDAKTGRYEQAVLTLTDRAHARGAVEAIDIIMKSALKRSR